MLLGSRVTLSKLNVIRLGNNRDRLLKANPKNYTKSQKQDKFSKIVFKVPLE